MAVVPRGLKQPGQVEFMDAPPPSWAVSIGVTVIVVAVLTLLIFVTSTAMFSAGYAKALREECVLHGGTPVADQCVNAQVVLPLRPETP